MSEVGEPGLEGAARRVAEELEATREELRRRPSRRLVICLLIVVLVAACGFAAGGLLYLRGTFCGFYVDLQPPPGSAQPVGEYGQRILRDAKSTAERLHC